MRDFKCALQFSFSSKTTPKYMIYSLCSITNVIILTFPLFSNLQFFYNCKNFRNFCSKFNNIPKCFKEISTSRIFSLKVPISMINGHRVYNVIEFYNCYRVNYKLAKTLKVKLNRNQLVNWYSKKCKYRKKILKLYQTGNLLSKIYF